MNLKSLVNVLEKNYRFDLKGTGTISYHIGCDFFCDSNGVYALPHTNILTRWYIPIGLCVVQNQIYTSLSDTL